MGIPRASTGPRATLHDRVARAGLRLAKAGGQRCAGDHAAFYEGYFTEKHVHEYHEDLRFRLRRKAVGDALASLAAGSKVVDLGFGVGDVLSAVPSHCRRYGMEFSEHNLRAARQRGLHRKTPLFRGSATELPLADASADALIMLEVLEHIPDDVRALREMARALKPGGLLLLSVPGSAWFPEYLPLMGHYRHYTRSRLVGMVEAAGFRVIRYVDDRRRVQELHFYVHAALSLAHRVLLRLGRHSPSLYHRRLPGSGRPLYAQAASVLARLGAPRTQADLTSDERSTFIVAERVP